MSVERFASATSPTTLVFCDANFLLDLASVESTAISNKHPATPRSRDAVAFLQRYAATHKTRFISSPYALEEIAHKVATTQFKSAKNKIGFQAADWKALKNENATTFEGVRKGAVALVSELWRSLQTFPVDYVVPSAGTGPYSSVTTSVVTIAVKFQQAYVELDAMDAYHLAMALACGASWFASSDRAFQSVSEINLFTGLP